MDGNTIPICENCANSKYCRKPCRPVEKWLRDGQTLIFEDKQGDVLISYGHWNEVRLSAIQPKDLGDKGSLYLSVEPDQEKRLIPEKEIPIKPKQLQAKVFYERFFKGKKNEKLAGEIGIPANHCSAIYSEARKRILKIVEALDGRDFGLQGLKKTKHELTEDQKWFLMNKVFGFSIAEISRMPGTPHRRTINLKINRLFNEYQEEGLIA